MAYSDLANNQGVSFNSLISGVSQGYFDAKTTIPSSTQITTKTACNTYVNVDPFYPPFAEKSDNQLVVKQDLRANEATLSITNSFFTGTITNVTVNGVSVTGGTFPINVGSSTTAYSNQIGTYDILVYYADATNPSNYMRITDSEYRDSCVDGFSSLGPGPYYVTFSSQILNTSITVNIISGDGQCTAPPPTLIANLPFSTVAVSRGTGQYMLAGNANIGNPYTEGSLFRSTNYGANWTLVGQFGYWYKVATSDNGEYMLAVEYYGRAYKSSDYGVTWTAINNFPFPDSQPCPSTPLSALQTLRFRGAALSATGQFQVISTAPISYGACGTLDYSYSAIFISTDWGDTWNPRQARSNDGAIFESVAISGTGETILATLGNINFGQGRILRSTNYGVTWAEIASSFNDGNLVDVAITSSGNQAIAARFNNVIVQPSFLPFLIRSLDGGITWDNITGTGPLGDGNPRQLWMRVAINTYLGLDIQASALANTNVSQKYINSCFDDLSQVVEMNQIGQKFYKGIANSNDGEYVLAGANNGLFVSNDNGFSWTAIQSTG
jgi:hypothetical protein